MEGTINVPNGGKIMEMTVPETATYLVNLFPHGSAYVWMGMNGSPITDTNNPYFFNCTTLSSSIRIMNLKKDMVLSLWNLSGGIATYNERSFIELIRIGS